jgi:hypothetical protein
MLKQKQRSQSTTIFEMVRDIASKAPKLVTKKDFTEMAPVDLATEIADCPDATVQHIEIANYLQKQCGRLRDFPSKRNGKDLSKVKGLLAR